MYGKVLKHAKDEPFYDYLKQAKNCLSSHAFIDYIKCPYFYNKKRLGLVPFKDKKSWVLGRAAHKMILEGQDAYNDEYQIGGGPVNPNTNEPFGTATKKYKEWADRQDKIIITTDQDYDVQMMNAGVDRHEDACKMILMGKAETVIRIKREQHWFQIKMDCFNPEYGLIDLKTCRNLDDFNKSVIDFSYLYQMAFYTLVIKWASGLDVPVHFIAVESAEPFRCGVFLVPDYIIKEHQIRILVGIKNYSEHLNEGEWPTRYEGIRTISCG